MTRIGSLFTGYGGLDGSVEQLLDADTVWHCDNDPAATKLLAHHYPHTPNLGDITTVDWHRVAAEQPIDVLTGGFPCTDVSAAGRRAGLTPTSQSGLWTHMARAIAVLQPRLVVIENVAGLHSALAVRDVEPDPQTVGNADAEPVLRAAGAVLGDLASLGFDAEWATVRASDVGAPHQRARVFLVAWPAADTDRVGPVRAGCKRDWRAGSPNDGAPAVGWDSYADSFLLWEHALGRAAPEPTVPGRRGGNPVLSAHFVEWMQGLPAGWVTDVPGIGRNDALRLLGNGVIPAQAHAALSMLLARDMPEEVPAA